MEWLKTGVDKVKKKILSFMHLFLYFLVQILIGDLKKLKKLLYCSMLETKLWYSKPLTKDGGIYQNL